MTLLKLAACSSSKSFKCFWHVVVVPCCVLGITLLIVPISHLLREFWSRLLQLALQLKLCLWKMFGNAMVNGFKKFQNIIHMFVKKSVPLITKKQANISRNYQLYLVIGSILIEPNWCFFYLCPAAAGRECNFPVSRLDRAWALRCGLPPSCARDCPPWCSCTWLRLEKK